MITNFKPTHWLTLGDQTRIKVRQKEAETYVDKNNVIYVGIPDSMATPLSRQALAAQKAPKRVNKDPKRNPPAKWAQVDWCMTDGELGVVLDVTPEAVHYQRRKVGLTRMEAYEIKGLLRARAEVKAYAARSKTIDPSFITRAIDAVVDHIKKGEG